MKWSYVTHENLIIPISTIIICWFAVMVDCQNQRETIEDKTFVKYEEDLTQRYKKDYLGAIFDNETTRQDFATFINNHLTDEVKSDLKAVRIFKKVDNAEVPVVSFSPNMDSWLGVLPQWKRIKKFMFNQMEAYVDSHPEILTNSRPSIVHQLPPRRTPIK